MSKKLDEIRSLNKRIFVISCLKICGLVALLSRLVHLQIFNGEKFSALADGNRVRLVIDPPERGKIYDRRSRVLADNLESETIVIETKLVKNFDHTINILTEILNVTDEHREALFKQRRKKMIVLGVPVNWRKIMEIAGHIPDLSGIKIISISQRRYPMSHFCAHVVGYTQFIATNNTPVLNDGKILTGAKGIEKTRDEILSGTPGTIKTEVNAWGNVVREVEHTPSIPGRDIHLSIDGKLQQYASGLFKEINGSMVVIDNKDGSILAMVNAPSYDPNDFSSGISHSKWGQLNNDPAAPMFNRAISWLTPPASTIKIVVSLAALSQGLINRDTIFNCTGSHTVGNRDFHCLSAHGQLDLQTALAVSCNVFFYSIAKNLDIDQTSNLARKLGLGMDNGFELSTDTKSIVPTTLWKLTRRMRRWQHGDSMNYVIGQGFWALSPLQLAVMIARIATRKELVPTLEIPKKPPAFGHIDIDNDMLDIVTHGLIRTMNRPYGSGYYACMRNDIHSLAGKTGTVQKTSVRKGGEENSLFVGFAPYQKPLYSICAATENPYSRDTKAVFLASSMMKFILEECE